MRVLFKVLVGVVAAMVVAGIVVYFTNKAPDQALTTTPGPATASTPSPVTIPAANTTPFPSTQGPVVRVRQGLLEGLNKRTRGNSGVEYAAFWGVPFAQPPEGPLRFKAPRPHPGWTGVRPAKKPGAKCPQGQNGEVEGSEDCLFLNVFTTNLDGAVKQPVYVFIHGGGFLFGSPDIALFGPDYLLPHGVVLVTVQYRVHALGFLSLDTEEIPGNCAVKDTVAALQWVHNNIAAFGGDPGRVTVGGQSAGGGMAGWLAVLPELTGIVHGATLMSGSGFHSWDYKESHVETALKVVSGLAGQPVTDLKLAEQYLMNATIEELHAHAVVVVNGEMLSQPELPFVPTPERRTPVPGGEPLLITRDSESYFLKPARPAIPQLISNTNAEWRTYYYTNNPRSDPQVDEEMVENLSRHVPKNLLPFRDTRNILGLPELHVDYNTVLEEVRQGIRAAVTSSCDLGCTLKTYFDGVWQLTDSHRLAMFRAKENKADTFLFKFSVRTEVNQPAPSRNDGEDVAIHTDDLGYVFARLWDTNLSPEADLAVRRMSTMWTNFIKFGKPIVQTDELLPVDWPPNTSSDDAVTYLELKTNGFSLHEADSFSGPMSQFWHDLYRKYRSTSPAPPVA
ncbi:juvenile hormone esterase-like isoform X2 [Thrips palmi]|uniref:Carboxylic ester hydrolase n=2 Tax=Thrips palmi TaxID=161013 RepID=A0A6P9AIZ5_THRPL|nr:juvenile hormone esterase-like isoform X2 [Thrips palmi]